jgi:hypothetical protein
MGNLSGLALADLLAFSATASATLVQFSAVTDLTGCPSNGPGFCISLANPNTYGLNAMFAIADRAEVIAAPEPSTLALGLLGLVAALSAQRHRGRREIAQLRDAGA